MTQMLVLAIVFFVLGLCLFLSGMFKDNKTIESLKNELDDVKQAYDVEHRQFQAYMKEHEETVNAMGSMEPIQVKYCISESDAMKYKNEDVMVDAIRSRLVMLLANDIVNRFGDPYVPEDGKYEYRFLITRL